MGSCGRRIDNLINYKEESTLFTGDLLLISFVRKKVRVIILIFFWSTKFKLIKYFTISDR
jgi:hypothetical protein